MPEITATQNLESIVIGRANAIQDSITQMAVQVGSLAVTVQTLVNVQEDYKSHAERLTRLETASELSKETARIASDLARETARTAFELRRETTEAATALAKSTTDRGRWIVNTCIAAGAALVTAVFTAAGFILLHWKP